MAPVVLLGLAHLLIAVALTITAVRPPLPRSRSAAYSVVALLAGDGACLVLLMLDLRFACVAVGLGLLLVTSWVAVALNFRRAMQLLPSREWPKEVFHEQVDDHLQGAEAALDQMRANSPSARIDE